MHEKLAPEQVFKNALDGNVPDGLATIKGCLQVLESGTPTTLQGLIEQLKSTTEKFKRFDCSSISVTSASDLFLRFITLKHAQLEQQDFAQCLNIMVERGREFLHKLEQSPAQISRHFEPYVSDCGSVLVHGPSQPVIEALRLAAKTKQFKVYITTSSSKCVEQLKVDNIQTLVIDDLAVGQIMGKMDCVLFGAEGVCESGGIVNQLGTYTIAIVAKQANKPVYTLAESYKFVRCYPLSQDDLPQEVKYYASKLEGFGGKTGSYCSPRVDYTPPSFLNLLFTEESILTPSAVSDRLISLYL